jgi:hypothetical protein
VPARLTDWGETTALSLIVISPEMLPATEGVKVTVIVQLAPAAKVDGLTGQVLLLAKFPLAVIEFNLLPTRWCPLLVSVTAFPALVAFSN